MPQKCGRLSSNGHKKQQWEWSLMNISSTLQLGKRGEEKDTDKAYARNILQSTAVIPQTFFNYITFLFQNINH